MIDLSNKKELLNYLKQHGLWAKKRFSQNFLVDKAALDKIVEAADLNSEELVVEIGPGTGILTERLVEESGHLISVELDRDLAGLLPSHLSNKYQAELLGEGKEIKKTEDANIVIDLNYKIIDSLHRFTLINADALRLNLDDIIAGRPYKVVANIPYAITSKIFELFLTKKKRPQSMVILVQKEVAERVCAKPGSMSTLAISVQLFGKPEIVDIVRADSFFPAPKVDSAILRIASYQSPVVSLQDQKEFFRCVHIGFAARRKTLVNNLSSGYQLDRKTVSDILIKIGLKETVRAQELTIDQWKKLCQLLK